MFETETDIATLNSLIETTMDSIDGYRRSADEAPNSRFAPEFRARAEEREQVVAMLRDEVRRQGGTPEEDGSLLAAAHRAFLTLRDRVTGSDDHAVIAEVDRGESYLNAKWEAAISNDRLSPETRDVIGRCYDSIRAGHDRWEQVHQQKDSARA
jgi:uncharacterized protein (TIGR02284 family)